MSRLVRAGRAVGLAGPSDDARSRASTTARAAAYALLLVLTVLLALWGSFLVPFRVGGTLVPVSWVVAGVGNVVLGRAGARLAGSTGAMAPGLLWLAVVLALAARRAEGDVVVPGTVVGLGFVLVGGLASAAAYGLAVLRPRR